MAPARSGQVTVATAGTAVVFGNQDIKGPLSVRALSGNSGAIYVGNDGSADVSSLTGYELAAGEQVVFVFVDNLIDLLVDAAAGGDGDKVCWVKL